MSNSGGIASRFDRWIFESYLVGPYALALCRIFFSSYILFFVFRPINWVGTYPSIFYVPPPSLARLFPTFPPEWFFHGLNILAVFFLLGVLFGYRTRGSSIGIFIVLFTYNTFAHSFGKIDHSILFVLFPLVMSFSNWGAAWSIDQARGKSKAQVQGWPITLMAVLLGFAMFTSGLYKLESGWLDLSTQATQSKVCSNVYAWQRGDLLAPFAAKFYAPRGWELLDWFTVIMEIGFLPAVFFPKIFRWFVGSAVFFHLGVLLLLNIDFSVNLFVYLPFVHWGKVSRYLGKGKARVIDSGNRFLKRMHPLFLLPIAGIFILVLYTYGCIWKMLLTWAGVEQPYLAGLLYLGGASLVTILLFFKKYRAVPTH